MPKQVIGKIPEFTDDETLSPESGIKEVKKAPTEEVEEEEKETPAELPAEEKPADEISDDTGDEQKKSKEIDALAIEKQRLLQEIQELRGQRREIKQEQFQEAKEEIDKLEDIDEESKKVIERVMRAKGMITKEEAQKMYYDTVIEEEKNRFLERYPEYKPANDPHDANWNALQKEIKDFYKAPKNPHQIKDVLEKAHKSIQIVSSERDTIPDKKRQIKVAGVGAGGVQRSSSKKHLADWQREEYRRGGWSGEEIKQLESSL